jgi:hypothetical protein
MDPWNLTECVIGLALGALFRICNIKTTFFVYTIAFVFFAAVAEPCLAKEIITLVKTDSDMYLNACPYKDCLLKYYVCHFVFNLRYRKILFLFWPTIGA